MPDVLIFDDDPTIGGLVGQILRDRGLTAAHFPSAAGVVQIIQENKPRLVVLDIMMPGVDGLSACRSIRANPATKHVKIVVLSAKDFANDKDTARRYGADLFVNKPFDAVAFARTVGRLLGVSEAAAAAAPQAPAAPVSVTLLAGGAAVELTSLWVLFDAGKGLREWLAAGRRAPATAWLLLSRYQEEALAEIGSAAALLAAGSRLNLAGPDDSESLLQRMAPRVCAGLPMSARATPLLYPQKEGQFQLAPGINALTVYTQHPGNCLAYRVELPGRVLVYCPAHEIKPDAASWNPHEWSKFKTFFAGADLLLHGFRRSLADRRLEDGKGDGAWEPVVEVAAQAKVKQLALFPLPGAAAPPDLSRRLQEKAAKAPGLKADLARCGQKLVF